MRRDCEHHVIDEKLVGLGRPAQRVHERRADMTNDLVVKAGAELTVELIDTRLAELIRDAVERRTRKIEMEGVVGLVDRKARIALHVVQIYRTWSDIRLGDALATLPEFTVRVIAIFQTDDKGILEGHRTGKPGSGLSLRASVTATSTPLSERVMSDGGACSSRRNFPTV